MLTKKVNLILLIMALTIVTAQAEDGYLSNNVYNITEQLFILNPTTTSNRLILFIKF